MASFKEITDRAKQIRIEKPEMKWMDACAAARAEFKKDGGGVEMKKGGQTKAGIAQDKKIKAMKGGKRESENGKTYYESRANHSDVNRTKKLAKGGDIESEWLVTLEGKDGGEIDEEVLAKTEDEAMDKAEKKHKGSKTLGVVRLTDEQGKKIEYAKGGGVPKASKKKKTKIVPPSDADLKRKAKKTGYRFKTDQFKKKDGELSEMGKKLKFKKPTDEEIAKFKKKGGKYPNKKIEIYYEQRNDRKHSDDKPHKKFEQGGTTDAKHGVVEPQVKPAEVIVTKVEYKEIPCAEFEAMIGRKPNQPYDFHNGEKYRRPLWKNHYIKCDPENWWHS